MLAGEPYLANDEVLTRERLAAKEMLFQLHALRPSQLSEREALLKRLLGRTHGDFYIEPPFCCDYGYNIEIGANFYANYNLVILDCAKVKIGSNVFIAPNVGIYTAGHPVYAQTRNTGLEFALPIEIGDNVWIGGNVVINPGVSIGNNTVIGSGSVVTRDVPPNVIAVGNPCRVLRPVTEQDKDYFYKTRTQEN